MSATRHKRVQPFDPAIGRRFLRVFLTAAIVLAAIVTALYWQNLRHQRAILEQESSYSVALEQGFLSLEFGAVQADLLHLARQETLKKFLSGDPNARESLVREYASFAHTKAVYDQVRFLDTTGQEIIRINYRDNEATIVPREQLQPKATRYYYKQALSLSEGEVFVSPFDLNVEHGKIQRPLKPVIRFLTPVFDQDGEKRGLLVLNYLGARLLRRMKEVSAGFRGDTMLLNRNGEYLQAPDPNFEWGWMLGHRQNFPAHFPKAWLRIQNQQQDQFYSRQDLFTFIVVPTTQRIALAGESTETPVADENSLLLVAHVSREVATAQSQLLLRQLVLMSLGTMVLVTVLALYWSKSGAVRDRQKRLIAESESRLRRLSTLLLTAQESERRTISRDLHDGLGQQITAISLDLKSMANEQVSERGRTLLQRAILETDHLLHSLHDIASRVRPSVLDDLGLQDAVESHIEDFEERTNICVRCELDFAGNEIPSTVGENVFRILQEALSNIAAHAQTDEATVKIDTTEDMLSMMIGDNGVGFVIEKAKQSTRLGLLGIQERVELLRGEFELESAPGGGTTIQIKIPLQHN